MTTFSVKRVDSQTVAVSAERLNVGYLMYVRAVTGERRNDACGMQLRAYNHDSLNARVSTNFDFTRRGKKRTNVSGTRRENVFSRQFRRSPLSLLAAAII